MKITAPIALILLAQGILLGNASAAPQMVKANVDMLGFPTKGVICLRGENTLFPAALAIYWFNSRADIHLLPPSLRG